MSRMSIVAGDERLGQAVAEEAISGIEHQVGEDAAGHHDRGDARADDVADAEQLGARPRRDDRRP